MCAKWNACIYCGLIPFLFRSICDLGTFTKLLFLAFSVYFNVLFHFIIFTSYTSQNPRILFTILFKYYLVIFYFEKILLELFIKSNELLFNLNFYSRKTIFKIPTKIRFRIYTQFPTWQYFYFILFLLTVFDF
jgi:hypothetical protein